MTSFSGFVRYTRCFPGLDLLPHRLEVPLHSVHPDCKQPFSTAKVRAHNPVLGRGVTRTRKDSTESTIRIRENMDRWCNLLRKVGSRSFGARVLTLMISLTFGFSVTHAPQASTQSTVQGSLQPEAQLRAWDEQYAAFVYDVVSIKPFKTNPGDNGSSLGSMETPDGYIADFPVIGLIDEAFRTDRVHGKTSGGPTWLVADYYDIKAKMNPEVFEALQKLSSRERFLARKHMLRVLLQDRFKVTVHFENREVPAYDLVVAKNGPKLKNAADLSASARDFTRKVSGSVFTITAKSQPASSLVGQLTADTGREVYDKTGLTGLYDFTLTYTPSQILDGAEMRPGGGPLTDAAQPPAKAIEQQLGLKLVSSTGLMQVVVVDHAERPSEN
jgi:uncharacterized protein (TIGR03435 family)